MEEKKPFWKSRTVQVLGVLLVFAIYQFYTALNLPTLSPEDVRAVEAVKPDVVRLVEAVSAQKWFDAIAIILSIAGIWFRYSATARLKR